MVNFQIVNVTDLVVHARQVYLTVHQSRYIDITTSKRSQAVTTLETSRNMMMSKSGLLLKNDRPVTTKRNT